MTEKEWETIGKIAGWSKQFEVKPCCGLSPKVVTLSLYGLGKTQLECSRCFRRGKVGETYGEAVDLWLDAFYN